MRLRTIAASLALTAMFGAAQAEPLLFRLDNVVYDAFGSASIIGVDVGGVCPGCIGGGGTLSTAIVDGSNVSLANIAFGLDVGSSKYLLTVDSAQTIVGQGVALLKSGVTCVAELGSACNPASTRSALLFPVDFTGQAADGTVCLICAVNVTLSGDQQTLSIAIRKQLTQGFGSPQTYILNYTLIPVPGAVWLFASALGLMGWLRRRAQA